MYIMNLSTQGNNEAENIKTVCMQLVHIHRAHMCRIHTFPFIEAFWLFLYFFQLILAVVNVCGNVVCAFTAYRFAFRLNK